ATDYRPGVHIGDRRLARDHSRHHHVKAVVLVVAAFRVDVIDEAAEMVESAFAFCVNVAVRRRGSTVLLDEFDLDRTRLGDRATHVHLDPAATMRRFGEDPADMLADEERPDPRRLLPLSDGGVEIIYNPRYLANLLCCEHFSPSLGVDLENSCDGLCRTGAELTQRGASLSVTVVDRSI